MSDENIGNPARWLLSIWDRIPRGTNVLAGPSLAGWARTFGTDLSDARVLECLNSTYANVETAASLVQSLAVSDLRKTQLLRWKPAFSEALVDVVNSRTWQHVASRFTPERRVNLEFCVTELDEAIGDRTTTLDDLQRLIASIETLQARLADDAGVDPLFRSFMHDMFEAIRRACAEYQIRGPQGVLEAMAYILSGLQRYSAQFKTDKENEWKGRLRETFSVASDVVNVTGVSAYVAVKMISSFIQ